MSDNSAFRIAGAGPLRSAPAKAFNPELFAESGGSFDFHPGENQARRAGFQLPGKSRFHLRPSENVCIPLSMSRLPFNLSDILNSLSELLTKSVGPLHEVISKCACRKGLVVSCLQSKNTAFGLAVLGLAQALHIGGRTKF